MVSIRKTVLRAASLQPTGRSNTREGFHTVKRELSQAAAGGQTATFRHSRLSLLESSDGIVRATFAERKATMFTSTLPTLPSTVSLIALSLNRLSTDSHPSPPPRRQHSPVVPLLNSVPPTSTPQNPASSNSSLAQPAFARNPNPMTTRPPGSRANPSTIRLAPSAAAHLVATIRDNGSSSPFAAIPETFWEASYRKSGIERNTFVNTSCTKSLASSVTPFPSSAPNRKLAACTDRRIFATPNHQGRLHRHRAIETVNFRRSCSSNQNNRRTSRLCRSKTKKRAVMHS